MADPQQMSREQMIALNAQIRNLIVASGLKRTSLETSQVINPVTQPIFQFQPRNVGLQVGFLVNVQFNVAVAGGGTPLTLTPWGASNAFSEIIYDDLNNNRRIQTTGRHINQINTARSGIPFAAVDALATLGGNAYPVSYGSWYPSLISAAPTIAAAANSDVNMLYYLPLAYSDDDLRGGVFSNVVQATQNLQFALNQQTVGARSLTNWLGSVYCTANEATAPLNVTVGNFTISVWRIYYDQLPVGNNGYLLPTLDLQTIYDIKHTTLGAPISGQDYSMPFTNFRDFLATTYTFVNRSDTTGAFATEADVNYLTMQAANYTEMFRVPPRIAATWARSTFGLDMPRGSFYIPTRKKPISTVAFGNVSIVSNFANVQTGAFTDIGYEAFSLQNQVGGAQSLPTKA